MNWLQGMLSVGEYRVPRASDLSSDGSFFARFLHCVCHYLMGPQGKVRVQSCSMPSICLTYCISVPVLSGIQTVVERAKWGTPDWWRWRWTLRVRDTLLRPASKWALERNLYNYLRQITTKYFEVHLLYCRGPQIVYTSLDFRRGFSTTLVMFSTVCNDSSDAGL